MNVNNNRQMMLGSFSSNQKDKLANRGEKENLNKNLNKNSSSLNAADKFTKMIENIQEQMKKVQENDSYDTETKKLKMEELQKQMEEIKKLEQEEKLSKMNPEKKTNEEKNHAENADGDKLTLSEEMESILKDEVSLDKLKNKETIKNKMKGEERLLNREIEVDKSRGANTERKEDRVSEIKDRVAAMDNNELEKITSNEKDKPKNKNGVNNDEKQDEIQDEKKLTQQANEVEETQI